MPLVSTALVSPTRCKFFFFFPLGRIPSYLEETHLTRHNRGGATARMVYDLVRTLRGKSIKWSWRTGEQD